jgi:hypothetical protein
MQDLVGVNEFVRRQTADSRFSHYTGTFEELAALANKYLYAKTTRQGYRVGVTEVDVPPEGFFCGVVQLRPGDKLVGTYESRRTGEAPRKHTCVVGGQKMPAKAVTLILYSYNVLLENHENSTMKPHELVSINARPTVEAEPINPGALIANHLGVDGGTATKMTDAEFVAALRVSQAYWQDKAMVAEAVRPTKVHPQEAGNYWCRGLLPGAKWGVVQLVMEGSMLCYVCEDGPMPVPTADMNCQSFEWVGPLEPPTKDRP